MVNGYATCAWRRIGDREFALVGRDDDGRLRAYIVFSETGDNKYRIQSRDIHGLFTALNVKRECIPLELNHAVERVDKRYTLLHYQSKLGEF